MKRLKKHLKYWKKKLCKAPNLKYPDFNHEFLLTTDASGVALSAVLSKGEISDDLPVTHSSRVRNDVDRKYSETGQVALTVVWHVEYFRPYLYGKNFI